MKNIIGPIFLFVLLMLLFSCATHPPSVTPSVSITTQPPSATSSGPRTIILDRDTIPEDSIGRFTSWYCEDYINGGATLVEVGYFTFPDSVISKLSESTELSELLELSELPELSELLESGGFVLYDGGYTGDYAIYHRKGLEHRWDWGDNHIYSFVILPDGTGAYYDFSTVPKGETTKPREIYKCYKR